MRKIAHKNPFNYMELQLTKEQIAYLDIKMKYCTNACIHVQAKTYMYGQYVKCLQFISLTVLRLKITCQSCHRFNQTTHRNCLSLFLYNYYFLVIITQTSYE